MVENEEDEKERTRRLMLWTLEESYKPGFLGSTLSSTFLSLVAYISLGDGRL
jgi:hypothetical protein